MNLPRNTRFHLAQFTRLSLLGLLFASSASMAMTYQYRQVVPGVSASAPPAPTAVNYTVLADTANFNLATALGGTLQSGAYVVTVEQGVTVSSTMAALPAFSTNGIPAGSVVTLINKGTIVGAGGKGGRGAGFSAGGMPGEDGGTAIYATVALKINNTPSGLLAGGGGGGGGGGNAPCGNMGGGGGGGAGRVPGGGGIGGYTSGVGYATSGAVGVFLTGGAGGGGYAVSGWAGGTGAVGGALGMPGGKGATSANCGGLGQAGFAGGAAGYAVQTAASASVEWLAGNSPTQVLGR